MGVPLHAGCTARTRAIPAVPLQLPSVTSSLRPHQRGALAALDSAAAAVLPCCGRAELASAAARPAQELPFDRSSRGAASPGGCGCPTRDDRACPQAPLTGRFKTHKISCCTGCGDAAPASALEAAAMHPVRTAPLAPRTCPRAAETTPRQAAGGALLGAGWPAGGRLPLAQLGSREVCGLVGGPQGVP